MFDNIKCHSGNKRVVATDDVFIGEINIAYNAVFEKATGYVHSYMDTYKNNRFVSAVKSETKGVEVEHAKKIS